MKNFSNSLIIERFKQELNIESDKELAQKLGVSSSTFANWKSPTKQKPSLVALVFEYAEKHNIDLNWVILGRKQEQSLDTSERMLLTAFNDLSDADKMQAVVFVGNLAKGGVSCGAAVSQSVDQSNNFGGVNQFVSGNK